MKIKTENLIGPALDWAVAKCEEYPMDIWYDEDGMPMVRDDEVPEWKPSTDWSQGGPIIEREWIEITNDGNNWIAVGRGFGNDAPEGKGSTPLVAAMRCYVASKLGEEVEVPDELITNLKESSNA